MREIISSRVSICQCVLLLPNTNVFVLSAKEFVFWLDSGACHGDSMLCAKSLIYVCVVELMRH